MQIFGGRELVPDTKFSGGAREMTTRDIGFHGVAPIIPGYVRDYQNSLGIQVDRPEVPSIGWHLTYARWEKHGNKKYANAKRGI